MGSLAAFEESRLSSASFWLPLADCHKNALQLAAGYGCKTIAFPNISTGVYRFPKTEAAKISVDAISQFLSQNHLPEKIILVCFDEENYAHVKRELLEKDEEAA